MSPSRDETSTMRTPRVGSLRDWFLRHTKRRSLCTPGTRQSSRFISNDVHGRPARRWPLLAQSPSGHVGVDTTPIRTPDQAEQVIEAEWCTDLQAAIIVKANSHRCRRLGPCSDAIGRTTQRLDVVAAEVIRVPRVHRRLIRGFPPDIGCSPDQLCLRSGISFRRQVSGVKERDIDVDDVGRVEAARRRTPDEIAQHAGAYPGVRQLRSSHRLEDAHEPWVGTNHPLQLTSPGHLACGAESSEAEAA